MKYNRVVFAMLLAFTSLLLMQSAVPTFAQVATNTPKPTSTVRSSATPRPSNTPKPTVTPRPTNTPKPTITPVGFIATRADDFGGGGTIIYSIRENNVAKIYAMDASGKNDTPLLPNFKGSQAYPQFLPDSDQFLFIGRLATEGSNHLYLSDLKGSEPTLIPGTEQIELFVISPDRSQAAILINKPDSLIAGNTITFTALSYIYNLKTKELRELPGEKNVTVIPVGWSSDSESFIALYTDNKTLFQMRQVSADGKGVTNLKKGVFLLSLAYSKTGKIAACITDVSGLTIALLDRLDSNTTKTLTSLGKQESCSSVHWSLDDAYILYQIDQYNNSKETKSTLRVVSVATKKVTIIKEALNFAAADWSSKTR